MYPKYWIQYNMFKDPVCNMMVDEKKAIYISEVGVKGFTYAPMDARMSLTEIQVNMYNEAERDNFP